MRKKVCLAAASLAVAGVAFAAPALGHAGHRSCAMGAHTFIVPLAQAGEAGEFASAQAKGGGLAEETATAHALLCEPAP